MRRGPLRGPLSDYTLGTAAGTGGFLAYLSLGTGGDQITRQGGDYGPPLKGDRCPSRTKKGPK
jgi:hypothetical protein